MVSADADKVGEVVGGVGGRLMGVRVKRAVNLVASPAYTRQRSVGRAT